MALKHHVQLAGQPAGQIVREVVDHAEAIVADRLRGLITEPAHDRMC